MSVHPILPGEFTQEFRLLFELCKLSDNRFDQKVSRSAVINTCGLSQDEAEQIICSLRESGLLVFDAVIGFLRITRYGISEIVTAKAAPHTRTAYFPSLIKMGIRLRRGHHLFDTVEPIWPSSAASPSPKTQNHSITGFSEGTHSSTEVNPFNQSIKRPSDKPLLTSMIDELEALEKQLAVPQRSVTRDPFEQLEVLIDRHCKACATTRSARVTTKLWTRSANIDDPTDRSTAKIVSELEQVSELLFAFN